jgi:hypothetical protein
LQRVKRHKSASKKATSNKPHSVFKEKRPVGRPPKHAESAVGMHTILQFVNFKARAHSAAVSAQTADSDDA